MGKLIQVNKPTEATYVIELTQSEVDMVGGIIADLLDNPQRKVSLDYAVDGGRYVPSKAGQKALKGAAKAFNPIEQGDEYDYFELWDGVADEDD